MESMGMVVRRYIDYHNYLSLLLLYWICSFFAAASLLFVHKKNVLIKLSRVSSFKRFLQSLLIRFVALKPRSTVALLTRNTSKSSTKVARLGSLYFSLVSSV